MGATQGHSRILRDRHFDDYASMKQHFRNSNIKEFIISGYDTTAGGVAEIDFSADIATHYIAAEGQVYIRCEADDANQHSKYVYIEYCDDAGLIYTNATADLNAADSTTEVIVTGADEFYRLRSMISEVESASGGGKAIILTDANMGGVDDHFGVIDDGNSQANIMRYFVPSATLCNTYLGRIKAYGTIINEGDTVATGFIVNVTYTPKAIADFTEDQAAADITMSLEFNEFLNWEPCIELQPATDVIIKIGDNGTVGEIFIEASYLEVYDIDYSR